MSFIVKLLWSLLYRPILSSCRVSSCRGVAPEVSIGSSSGTAVRGCTGCARGQHLVKAVVAGGNTMLHAGLERYVTNLARFKKNIEGERGLAVLLNESRRY